MLAPEVVAWDVRRAAEGFDARFSATAREYRYRIDTGPWPDPFEARFVWHRPGALALAPMREAARTLLGEHDFASFCRRPQSGGTVRRLERLSIARVGDRVEISARANAFLHQMVRALVGTLVAVGDGRLDARRRPRRSSERATALGPHDGAGARAHARTRDLREARGPAPDLTRTFTRHRGSQAARPRDLTNRRADIRYGGAPAADARGGARARRRRTRGRADRGWDRRDGRAQHGPRPPRDADGRLAPDGARRVAARERPPVPRRRRDLHADHARAPRAHRARPGVALGGVAADPQPGDGRGQSRDRLARRRRAPRARRMGRRGRPGAGGWHDAFACRGGSSSRA